MPTVQPSLRSATDADLPFCEALNRSGMSAYLAARAIAWEPDRYRASWGVFDNRVIDLQDEPVGVLRLLEVDGALELRDLQVVPAYRGRGLGGWAIAQAEIEACARGVVQLRLRVYAENPARRLYARSGFKVCANHAGTLHMTCVVPRHRADASY